MPPDPRETTDLPHNSSARGRATMARIARATLELAAESPDGDVPLRAVADAADIALGTLHTHFASRDALMVFVADAFWDEQTAVRDAVVAALPEGAPPREILAHAVRAYLAHMQRSVGAIRLFIRATASPPVARRFQERGERFLAELLAVAPRHLGVLWTADLAARAPAALRVLVAMARDAVVSAPRTPRTLTAPSDALADELTAAVLTTLACAPPA